MLIVADKAKKVSWIIFKKKKKTLSPLHRVNEVMIIAWFFSPVPHTHMHAHKYTLVCTLYVCANLSLSFSC